LNDFQHQRGHASDQTAEPSWSSPWPTVAHQQHAQTSDASTCPSDDSDDVIELPGMTLFVSPSAASKSERAFEALDALGIPFRVCPATTSETPSVNWDGTIYSGLTEITALSGALSAFQDALIARVREHRPRLFEDIDQHDADTSVAEHAARRRAARADLEAILGGRH
jgi:hypothetical protein